jgi:polysaccharide export outer membrane protein
MGTRRGDRRGHRLGHWWSWMVWGCLLLGTPALSQERLLGGGEMAGRRSEVIRPDYRIGPGDVLLIEVAGEPDLRRKVKVMQRGTIRLPYIPRDLEIAGLSEADVTTLLRDEFKTILKDPQVTLFIEEYHARMVSIAGAVQQPKQVPLTRDLYLYDLISLAGGITAKAGSVIHLVRTQPEESMEVIDLQDLVRQPQLNRLLRDGDFLNVPEAGVFYVTGNVRNPGSFPIKETVKLSQAIAMAGGLLPNTIRREIKLVRATNPDQTEATEMMVDLIELERDPQKDPLLKPYDVVMIPESGRVKQTKSLLQALAGGFASTLGWVLLR